MKLKKYNHWRKEDKRDLEKIKETREIENNAIDTFEKFFLMKYEIYKLENGEYTLFKTIPFPCFVLYAILLFFMACAFTIQEGFTEIRDWKTKRKRYKKYRKAKKVK